MWDSSQNETESAQRQKGRTLWRGEAERLEILTVVENAKHSYARARGNPSVCALADALE